MSTELELTLFGPYDAEEFCRRYCENDRHAKFCTLSVFGRNDRDAEIARAEAERV